MTTDPHGDFRRKVKKTQQRKIRSQRQGDQGIWFGFGMFGLVGWSVALPALIAIAVGIWIDARFAGQYSWTLMMLVIGIGVGCLNAWFWVSRERTNIEDEFHHKQQNDGPKGKQNDH
ncbi:MAG: AtpZ/AtpI family protein [Pelovirga sp.]